jgi:hypothetical protein
MYGTKTVYREQKDSSGTSIGMDKHVEATVEGRVLMAAGEPVKDRFDRLYVGIPIEAEPGFDRYVQSADPLIHEQLLSLAKGDVVRAKGVLQSSKRGNGSNIRLESITVISKAPQGPIAVAAASSNSGEQAA